VIAADVDPAMRAEADELAASGLLDGPWYLARHADVSTAKLDPHLHFCQFGWMEKRQPNAYFDTAWYLEQSPDVAAANMNPLLHYIRHGENEGRRPMQQFDPAWYRVAYDLPNGVGPLHHFLRLRGSGKFAPDSSLYAVPHLPPYRYTAAAGRDPFQHYLSDMQSLGCEAFPDPAVVTASELLDPNYYLINGTDVHEARLDPAEHFCRYGWREGRRPNIYFDTAWYLRTNPEVARLKINPLVHYILQGEAANRRPVVYFDPGWYRATYAVEPGRTALAHFLTHRRSQTVSPTPLFDVAWYMAQHGVRVGANRDPFAHYLLIGILENVDPSPEFDTAKYRKDHIGRPSRQFRGLMQTSTHNPLVHFLYAQYRRVR
jgi:hypothetical protein